VKPSRTRSNQVIEALIFGAKQYSQQLRQEALMAIR
jgi:hypothetical protein